MWAGAVNHPEAFKASTSLGASSYPFIAVVCNNNVGSITLLDRIEGYILVEDLMLRLSYILENHGQTLIDAKRQTEERELNRRLREEQDLAFTQSLLLDQQKERQAQHPQIIEPTVASMSNESSDDDQTAHVQQQREELLKMEISRKKSAARNRVPVEPDPNSNDSNTNRVSQLVIRLPDGSRVQRRFRVTDKIQAIYDFVDCQDQMEIDQSRYNLIANFPRRVFQDRLVSLEEAGLYPQASLFVQEKMDG